MESKSNILVVDDNPDKLSLIEAALSLAGYNVTTATDGDEALAAIESYQPDLVVTDVMMPRMNGYELAQRIRANPLTKFIPVIMQTAAGRRAEDLRAEPTVGALGYITDPAILTCCSPGPEHCLNSKLISTFVKRLPSRTTLPVLRIADDLNGSSNEKSGVCNALDILSVC